MNRIRPVACLIGLCGLVASAHAGTAISRFDTGLDGWTIQGPGLLEWSPTGGTSGGCLKITRTGPGEVYLIAPAGYGASCSDWWPQILPLLTMDVKTDRAVGRPLTVIVQTGSSTMFTAAEVGCGQCWFPSHVGFLVGPNPIDWQPLRIQMGVDPALPVGEVMYLDNIEFRTCAANCDGSTGSPVLTVNDFQCFLNAFARGDAYANFSPGHAPPYLNADDFQAFLNTYAAGCACP